jgi:CDGSH-type Zn-finger protein/truncated hemoglobin YjbI
VNAGQHSTHVTPAGGQGPLAATIATRGGLAAPEAPFVIEHREALIYMLCEAAELEHGIMCQYLFAAFSLKQSGSEGLTDAEADAVRRWRKQVSHVAAQEMLHLALVQNLLSAIGGPPHMVRPNLPAPASHYPAAVQLALIPFGEQALRHFMFLERPEGMALDDADGLTAVSRAAPIMSERDIVPSGQDFATVGHLYRSIEAGFAHLAEQHGEDWLFIGPPRAQATARHFRWPELVAVTDLASAQQAIERILEQGEGPRGDWRNAHFGQFVSILDDYQRMREENPGFEPVRPVLAANVRPAERDAALPLISDPLTARVSDLFNVGYEILLQTLERFFAHTEETDAQLTVLADATVGLMLRVIKPLGDLITTLPVGPSHPGRTAGPSFELFYEADYLLPHQQAAWALLAERLYAAAWLCDELRTGKGQQIAPQLEPVLAALRELSATFAAHLPASSPHAELATRPAQLPAADLDALLTRAEDLAARVPHATGPAHEELAGLFEAVHTVVTSAAAGQGCGPQDTAILVPRLVDSVLRPLAAAMEPAGAAPAKARRDSGRGKDRARVPQPRSSGPSAAESVWTAAKTATSLRVRLGRAGQCPNGLAEATAALQDLAGRLESPVRAAAQRSELWQLQRGLPASIQAAHNGPLLVTSVPKLTDHLGAETRPHPQLALCRCGNSAIKPLCDGSHARTGFTEGKDPRRVADRRDSYEGQQVTILDNRGICQHSGRCTDRLAAVFRTDSEPFVAPSGGRLDEIIRAVRDCPSGALSYAIDGVEARSQVDWNDTREPAIEVSKDGPYRITGSVTLLDADGGATVRNQGASTEHSALCRCGHSQNKPFCSGMHWYVGFADPVAARGSEPTLFEWVGGLPELTRMSSLLYAKHVPADPLLAAAFANMPPDQPQRLAGWLAAALGGPPVGEQEADPRTATGLTGPDLGDPDRARWVTLAGRAADEAKWPADAGFRSAFAACIDWLSRAALTPPESRPAGEAATPPQWGWGPGGPPAPRNDSTGPEAEQATDAPLPAAGEALSFEAHIKKLFRERDRQSMTFAFDLWSCDDVRAHAADILERLEQGSMPCDGAWPAEKVDVFKRWTQTGMAA